MPGLKVPQQNIVQIITLPPLFCLLHIVHPSAISSPGKCHKHTPSCPAGANENVIHLTRPPSTIAPWSRSVVHVPIIDPFCGVQGSARALCPVYRYAAPSFLGQVSVHILGTQAMRSSLLEKLWPSHSHHNLAPVKGSLILTLVYFSYFPHINFNNWLQ